MVTHKKALPIRRKASLIRRKALLIGFDGSRAFSNQKTGTEQYSYQLLKAISLIDKENQYVVYLRPSNTEKKWLVDLQNEWPLNFQFKVLNYPYLWTQVGLAIATFTDKLDVLFVPSHTLPLVKKADLDTIMTVHDLGAEFLPATHQLKQKLYLKFITDVQLKTASHLIAVSNATKQDLIKKVGISKDQITVIYEGLNESEASAEMLDSDLGKFQLEKGNYFLFVGTVQPRKNIARLITAFKGFCNVHQNKNFKLVIAGSKGWLSDDIYRLPKQLGIEKQVQFLGRVSDSEKQLLYKNARALTFPSLFEGFGLPILEAYAAKIPVITSNTSSMPEVAGNGAILVNPNSTEELIEAMIKITTDQNLVDGLLKEGQLQLKKFSWKIAAQETIALFNRVKGS